MAAFSRLLAAAPTVDSCTMTPGQIVRRDATWLADRQACKPIAWRHPDRLLGDDEDPGLALALGDTRSPMLAHLAGYWIAGLPVTYVLCFPLGWGVRGIWVGLTSAIVIVGVALTLVWARRTGTGRAGSAG